MIRDGGGGNLSACTVDCKPVSSARVGEDRIRMKAALALAQGQLGLVWPNPAVGCVIWSTDGCVGRGATQVGGRPHAEVVALAEAGAAARGGTAYVSLEPCNHWGKTPPCVDALLGAEVARVVIAVQDPDPRTNGKGIARLRSRGVEVVVGLETEPAAEINAGFFTRVQEGRPLVSVLALGGVQDPVDVRHDAIVRGLDGGVEPVLEVHTGGPRRRRWVVAPPETAVFGGQPVSYTVGADRAANLRSAMAALGALGLTRVAVDRGDSLRAAFEAAGLVDRTPVDSDPGSEAASGRRDPGRESPK